MINLLNDLQGVLIKGNVLLASGVDSASNAGDWNDDGIDDVIITDNSGQALIVLGQTGSVGALIVT